MILIGQPLTEHDIPINFRYLFSTSSQAEYVFNKCIRHAQGRKLNKALDTSDTFA